VSATPDGSAPGAFRVDLRGARAGDGRAIAQVLADHDRFDGLADDLDRAAVRIESLLPDAHDPLRTLLVADEVLAGVVGYVHWQVTYPVFLDGPSLYLTELFVATPHRGRGVGSRLLDAVHAEADALGAARVELVQVRDTDAHRRGFYRDRGYRHADHLDVLRR
jgi:GNAT superfamily N-acetyltransferase